MLPNDLDFDGLRWADLALGLGAERAAWAALPWVMESLVAAGAVPADEPVVVLRDTFVALGDLSGLHSAGDKLAARARHVDEQLGAWGGFAPGLLVAPGQRGWGGWWKQRAMELASSSAPLPAADPFWELPLDAHTIVDPALCLSADTAAEIDLAADGSLASDGRAPALVDFRGLDPRRPWWFAPPGHRPRAMLGDSPGLARLCAEHVERLRAAGWAPTEESTDVDREQLLPGLDASPELRRWYRERIAGRARGRLPPNPLVSGEVGAFVDSLRAPGDREGTGVNVHVDQLLERRDDLIAAFPHARWRDRREWRRWLWSHGLAEGETSLLTLPELPAAPRVHRVTDVRRPFGVNLVGYLGAELGLGVAARRLRSAFDAADVPHCEVSYDRTSSNLRTASTGGTERPYHFTVLVITPDQLPLFVEDVGEGFLAGHHNIGLWYWESDVVAPQQEAAFGLVQEIWVATNYLTRAFAGPGRPPVRVVPSPLVFDDPELRPGDRERLGLDDRFTYLFSFDFLSVAERKNPAGLAEAYRRAFPTEDGGTRLLLKSINGHIFPEQRERLMWEIADRHDIDLRDELLSGQDRLGLVDAADCYVSLHRSEGLGLTMAEAMAVGTPVIATDYSGNQDFMSPGSALLVPAREVEVGPGQYYPEHGHWAEPDLDEAAAMMRRVRDEPELRETLGTAGREALARFSYGSVGSIARDALLDVWKT